MDGNPIGISENLYENEEKELQNDTFVIEIKGRLHTLCKSSSVMTREGFPHVTVMQSSGLIQLKNSPPR